MRTAFEAEGDIRGMDLLAGLVALWRDAASGTLHFSRSGASAAFRLAAGEIVGVTSSEPRFETAAILLRAGKLDAATLDRLATPGGGDRARAAVQAGILTRREWRWGEKIRAVEVLSDLLSWLDGEYVFEGGTPEQESEFRLTVPRLVLELFLRSRDRNLVLHYVGGVDVPLARSRNFDAEFPTFGLTSDAESVVRLIDGSSTAAEIAAEAPADSFAVEKLLAALVTLGLVHPEFAADSLPPSPARVDAAEDAGDEADAEADDDEAREAAGEEEAEGEPGGEPADAGEDEEAGEPVPDFEEAPPAEHAEDAEWPRGDARTRAIDPATELMELAVPEIVGLETPRSAAPTEAFAETPLEPDRRSPPARPSLEWEAEDSLAGGFGGAGERLSRSAAFDAEMGTASNSDSDSDGRSRRGSAGPYLWLIALLAAGVAALILLRGRGRSPGPEPRLAAAATPAAIVTASAVPTEVPTALPAVSPARVRPTAAAPRPGAARPTPVPAPPAAIATTAAAREGSRASWLERAARDKRRALGDRKARYAIQLELACETASLVDAWKHDRPAGTMWLMSTPFRDRTCFRVLWGRYPTREAARRALSGAPAFFATARNRPIVVGIH